MIRSRCVLGCEGVCGLVRVYVWEGGVTLNVANAGWSLRQKALKLLLLLQRERK